jgi:hypothetical protein
LAGVQRQANVVQAGQRTDRGERFAQSLSQGRRLVESRHPRMAVERQQVAAQAQHAQGRRQARHIGQQGHLRLQIVLYHFQQLGLGDFRGDTVHPAQGGGARVERRLDAFQSSRRQVALGMAVLAGEADARVTHGHSSVGRA